MNELEKCLFFDPASTDWMDDCVKEVSFVCECDERTARAMIEEELRFDKLCKQRVLSVVEYNKGPDLPPQFHYVILQITQPLRVPGPARLSSLRTVLEFMESASTSRGTVLEYGGGGGRDAIAFARRGFRPVLLETGPYLMNQSEGPMVARRFKGRGLHVPFIQSALTADDLFDMANCIDVLEHVYDVEYVLAEITCKLRPGGLFFVWGDFDNVTCNGDHLERNRFYARSGVWHLLREALGYTLVSHRPHGAQVQVWKLENKREVGLEELLITVYETTRRHARGWIVKNYLKALLPRGRGWTMQNLADAIHTYGFTSERLRKLSPQGAGSQLQGNGRPSDR